MWYFILCIFSWKILIPRPTERHQFVQLSKQKVKIFPFFVYSRIPSEHNNFQMETNEAKTCLQSHLYLSAVVCLTVASDAPKCLRKDNTSPLRNTRIYLLTSFPLEHYLSPSHTSICVENNSWTGAFTPLKASPINYRCKISSAATRLHIYSWKRKTCGRQKYFMFPLVIVVPDETIVSSIFL